MKKYVKIDEVEIVRLEDEISYPCNRANFTNTMCYPGSIIKAHYMLGGKLILGIYLELSIKEQIKQIKL